MPRGINQLTSLLVRELAIASKNFGQLGRTCWELSRVLLQADEYYDKMTINKGESGAEDMSEAAGLPSQTSDPFSTPLHEDYD